MIYRVMLGVLICGNYKTEVEAKNIQDEYVKEGVIGTRVVPVA